MIQNNYKFDPAPRFDLMGNAKAKVCEVNRMLTDLGPRGSASEKIPDLRGDLRGLARGD